MARSDGIELLPDGADEIEGGGDEFDLSSLTVDFSSQEADSEAREFVAIPGGKYHVKVTECLIKQCGPGSRNPGKPYYNMQLNVQDGPYQGRKLFTNVMLFPGALYTLSQLMKALGWTVGTGVKIPQPTDLIGQDFLVIVQKMVDKYKIEQGEWDGEGPKPTKNEVKGFVRWDGEVPTKVPGSAGSLLP
jgi:hypothetical protein